MPFMFKQPPPQGAPSGVYGMPPVFKDMPHGGPGAPGDRILPGQGPFAHNYPFTHGGDPDPRQFGFDPDHPGVYNPWLNYPVVTDSPEDQDPGPPRGVEGFPITGYGPTPNDMRPITGGGEYYDPEWNWWNDIFGPDIGSYEDLINLLTGGGVDYSYLYEGESPYDQEYYDWAQGVYDFLRTGGEQEDFMSAWEPYRDIMEGQIERGAADLLEQFGNMGAQYGTGAIEGVSEFIQSGEAQINNTLAQMAYQAERDQLARQMEGMMRLSEMLYGSEEAYADRYGSIMSTLDQLIQADPQNAMILQQLAAAIQSQDQAAIDFAYQEFLRTWQGRLPEIYSFLGTPSPGTGQPQYQQSTMETMAPIIASIIGAMIMACSKEWKTPPQSINKSFILEKLRKLPVHEWEYTMLPGVRHIGPMAEDFKEAFDLGYSDKVICSVDAFGVLIASIQELLSRVEALELQGVRHG